MPLALAARRAAAAAGRRGLTAKAKGGSSEEMVALSRLSRAKATPYRVVLKLGNTNVKAAIIDDQRDLTVRGLPFVSRGSAARAASCR